MVLSIVTPVWNRAQTIERMILSILHQLYGEWELILVDDGSSDNIKSVIQPFTQVDSRIKTIFLADNHGPGYARNRGVEICRGEWIVFLDSDNELLPGALATISQTAALVDVNVGIILFSALEAGTGRPCGYASADVHNGMETTYEDWLKGERFWGEFLPVTRYKVWENHRFLEFTYGYEGLTWWSIAKTWQTRLYLTPVELYYTDTPKRLCSAPMSIMRAAANLRGAFYGLEKFGVDLKAIAPKKYADLLKDVGRKAVLAREWRYVWTSCTKLALECGSAYGIIFLVKYVLGKRISAAITSFRARIISGYNQVHPSS